MDEIEQRKAEVVSFLKKYKNKLIYLVFAVIAWFGYYIRTQNLGILNWKYIPDVDSYIFLRLAKYIAEHGKLMIVDTMRYFPIGFDSMGEFRILSYAMAYLYKFLAFLDSIHLYPYPGPVTIEHSAILYPPIAFVIALVFFFLFVRKIFNTKVALLSSFLLTIIPAFLYRTMAGVSDKEAFATIFMFASLYFYASIIKAEDNKWKVIHGILCGLSTGIMGLVWGGINFMFLTLACYMLIMLFFNRASTFDMIGHCIAIILTMLLMIIGNPETYYIRLFFVFVTSAIALFSVLACGVHYFLLNIDTFKIKEKIKDKYPLGVATMGLSLCVAFLGMTFILGPEGILRQMNQIFTNLVEPFGTTRWALTVAESNQPYFINWVGDMGWIYISLFFAGSVLLFYKNVINLKEKFWLTVAYTTFILMFSMSRYKPGSIFDGVSTLSHVTYIGSLVAFAALIILGYVSLYRKNKNIDEVFNLNPVSVLIFAYFFFNIIGARSAIRLFYTFAPATAILAAYFIIWIFFEYKFEDSNVKYGVFAILLLLLLMPINLCSVQDCRGIIVSYSSNSINSAKYMGPSYNPQWQAAGNWAQNNTPENAIFAHWWDYGYWVQSGFNRATVTDGGNLFYPLNYFMGRHFLTATSEEEALKFFINHNVTHALIVSDEIGKYPAFSSIGADKNNDRYSWISTFALNPEQTRETRNETVMIYTGGSALDDDFIFQDKIYPALSTGVIGFAIPYYKETVLKDNNSEETVIFEQPSAFLYYQNQQIQVPMNCIYFDNKEYNFEGEGLGGCLRITPVIQSNQMDPLGALMYLSKDVYDSLFTKLYLFGRESENFKLAYSDESGMPIAIYNGRIIGPIKIWEVHYPKNITKDLEYQKYLSNEGMAQAYQDIVAEGVTKVIR